jgi:hypothetical protein
VALSRLLKVTDGESKFNVFITHLDILLGDSMRRPPLWSSGQEFLATDPEARVRFPALPETKNSVSGTGSTQLREYN